jgi:hypothetical protein
MEKEAIFRFLKASTNDNLKNDYFEEINFTFSSATMTPLFKKMNFKVSDATGRDQDPIAVLRAPDEFLPEIEAMREFSEVHQTAQNGLKYGFFLAFVKSAAEMTTIAKSLSKHLAEDAVFWIAYPKKSSQKYKSDINRDSGGWTVLGSLGYEGVRSVAIDEDWSALRFRNVKFIKKMTRDSSWAMSEEGKTKTKKD